MTRLTASAAATALGAILLVDLVNLGDPELDPVAHMASYFVHGRSGWLIPVAALAIALTAFSVVPLVRRHRVAACGVGMFGMGLTVAGLVPTQPVGNWDAAPSTATLVHGVAAWLAFVALPVAALWLNRRWPDRPLTRTRSAFAWAIAVLLVLLTAGTAEVMDGPDHLGYLVGLLERLLIAASLAWLVATARAAAAGATSDDARHA